MHETNRRSRRISIFNDVIGPVMRGPSSSHTAGAYHLATLTRSLLGETPLQAECTFDPDGSYGKVYREQGADLAFAAGWMDRPLIDARFEASLADARDAGLSIRFEISPLEGADHPNTVRIRLTGRGGKRLEALARSIGGGAIEITSLDGRSVLLTGMTHEVVVEAEPDGVPEVVTLLTEDGEVTREADWATYGDNVVVAVKRRAPLADPVRARLVSTAGVRRVWTGTPLSFVKKGNPCFTCAAEMIALAEKNGSTLGELAAGYEAELLGLARPAVLEEAQRRLEIMLESVEIGLGPNVPRCQLLPPSAGAIYAAEEAGKLFCGGIHTRTAARAMATMHVNGGMGVVCAAPTAGSAGVLPAVLTTLCYEKGLSREDAARCLLAAGAVGVIVAERATFAAEVAGCQVEIGAAGAMAAAAVVEAAGGTVRQAADAAAISFQNSMGSVCDLVQGIVEIPCHTRNAAAASSALVTADLVLGGYANPIPLDETIDAVYAVGRLLPPELRCTALGGLAVTPSARAMKRLR